MFDEGYFNNKLANSQRDIGFIEVKRSEGCKIGYEVNIPKSKNAMMKEFLQKIVTEREKKLSKSINKRMEI